MCGFNTNPSMTSKPTSFKYLFNFDGKIIETILTDEAFIADRWVGEILSVYAGEPMVVGLDIEWSPRSMTQKPATLQLCVDGKCLILQLFYMDKIPRYLRCFLSDSNFTFVGVEVMNDIDKLKFEYGLDCACSADIRELAMQRWPGRFKWPELKELAREVANLEMAKPNDVVMSNWEARDLDENQVKYACSDAYASYKIGHKLIIGSCTEAYASYKIGHKLIIESCTEARACTGARACVSFPALARAWCLCIERVFFFSFIFHFLLVCWYSR